MSIRNLDSLFAPNSVAVIGASTRPGTVGNVVVHNLLDGDFAGPIMPVNPKYDSVAGVLCYRKIGALPVTPELAVVCTPAPTVPGIIAELGAMGTKAAVVLSAGLNIETRSGTRTLRDVMLQAAQPHLLRVLGHNCVGLVVPGAGLNASFAHTTVKPGTIAFVSQSGALCTAVLDWASTRDIGFSHFVSLGNSDDVDFGDVLDYLGSDPHTQTILLYIESVGDARKFMSAARAASRNKPVVAIKAGRRPEGAAAAASHTGAMMGSDVVYDAALRRAGILRVHTTEELFDAVETLARVTMPRGDRLAILTNGGGPGVMAADCLSDGPGRLAQLSEETIAALDGVLPSTWSRRNPIDIIGDAGHDRYAEALKIVQDDPAADCVLVMHAPTAVASAGQAAEAVIEVQRESHKSVLTCWLGGQAVADARGRFAEAGIPSYATPDQAVSAFSHLIEFRQNRKMLMETPPSAPEEFTPVVATARAVIEMAIAQGREVMTEPETKAVLAAYGIPVVETHTARNADEAVRYAEEIGYPVALKILSRDITHKSSVGGVALDLESADDVHGAVQAIQERCRRLAPDAHIEGFTVQQMARRPGAHELIVGTACDPVFGPVILFGHGGTGVEVIADRAVALPPLNMNLAERLIGQTRVNALLEGYRDRPAVDRDALRLTLLKVSQMVVDLPELVELDINPLFTDEHGVLALDARMRVAPPAAADGARRLAIRPYPKGLEEVVELKGRKVLLRPIRPEDEPAHQEFFRQLSPDDIRFRFFGLVRSLPHSEMARFTQIDYDRDMAFIAVPEDGTGETLGVVRIATDPNNQRAEYAIIVRSDQKGQGLGTALLDKIIRYCKARGTEMIVGQVLRENHPMLSMAEHFGFRVRTPPGGDAVEVVLELNPATATEEN